MKYGIIFRVDILDVWELRKEESGFSELDAIQQIILEYTGGEVDLTQDYLCETPTGERSHPLYSSYREDFSSASYRVLVLCRDSSIGGWLERAPDCCQLVHRILMKPQKQDD